MFLANITTSRSKCQEKFINVDRDLYESFARRGNKTPENHSNDCREPGISAEQSGRHPSAIPFMEHADGMGPVML